MSDVERRVLCGERVLLRPPRDSDRADRLAAGRDFEFWRMVGGTGPAPGPLTADEVDRWLASACREPHAWIVERNGRCIGLARPHHIEHDSRTAQYAVGLFRPGDRGHGFGREVTELVLQYAFEKLGLERVLLRVLDFNHTAIACYRRCGFIETGREPVQLGAAEAIDIIMTAVAQGGLAEMNLMTFDLERSIDVLSRTPATLRVLLAGLDDSWIRSDEGPDTFSPFDNIGHLIDGEETDWVPRARIILARGPDPRFEPYDRFRHRARNAGRMLSSLLDEFAALRAQNLDVMRSWRLTETDLDLEATHPALGRVTLRQLLASYVVHDLGHVAQIARVMAKQYREAIGPWKPFLPVVTDHETPRS